MGIRLIAGAVMLVAGVSGAMANDALLTEALSRPAFPIKQINGSIRTTTSIIGGAKPEVETDRVDAKKSPDRALASYTDLKHVIGQDARMLRRDAGHSIYGFTTRRVPQATSGTGSLRIGRHESGEEQVFRGEAEVAIDAKSHPYVSHVYLYLPHAAGSLFTARIKKMSLNYSFAPVMGKDAMVATAVSADVDVRALLFVHRAAHSDAVLVMAER